MKALTTNGLTKLIQLIKSTFIPKTDVETTTEMDVVTATAVNIDNTPTQSSTNLVTSGGVYSALADKYDASNPNGYTSNVGTVTSVNNTSPDSNGNVTLSIPAAQVNSDWNANSGVAQILNKPTLGTMAAESASDYTPTSGLATVATSGSYNDLSNTPTIPAAQVNSDWNASSGVAEILNKPTTLAGYGITDGANTDLSNLTDTGANIANWSSNVSNCITEIPQDINLTLSSGTLTLKAGSKVYIPNGAGVFDVYTVASDISSNSFAGSVTRFVFVDINNNTINAASAVFSGSSAPTLSGTGFWYDTTNNVIKRTTDSGATWTTGYSFPIAIVTSVSDVATSIDQVFNGFGYIGSTVFALPGVSGLIPNGRNADGTLKNTVFTVNNVITKTTSYDFGSQCVLIMRDTGIDYVKQDFYLESETTPTLKQYARLYQSTENQIYYGGASAWEKISAFNFGLMTLDSSGKITSFSTKTPFHALDYNDSEYIAHQATPSSKYINLTLPASNNSIIAPADGYVYLNKTTNGANQDIFIIDDTTGMRVSDAKAGSGSWCAACLCVAKGASVRIVYSAGGTTNDFKFIYANGAA